MVRAPRRGRPSLAERLSRVPGGAADALSTGRQRHIDLHSRRLVGRQRRLFGRRLYVGLGEHLYAERPAGDGPVSVPPGRFATGGMSKRREARPPCLRRPSPRQLTLCRARASGKLSRTVLLPRSNDPFLRVSARSSGARCQAGQASPFRLSALSFGALGRKALHPHAKP